MKKTLFVLFVLPAIHVCGQVIIFTEDAGSPSSNTAITAHTFQHSGTYTYTGSADVRNSISSSGYTGASGNGNVFFTNTVGKDFQVSAINTTGYTSLSLSFGQFKNLPAMSNELIVEVSSDGTSYSPLSYSRTTGAGTNTWALISASGSIPSTSNLRIRFRQTLSGVNSFFRIDDIQLTGTAVCIAGAAPTINSGSFSAIASCTAATVSFIPGNGLNRLAVLSTSNFSSTPANCTSYTANPVYGTGISVGTGNYTVLNANKATVSVTGLLANTTYYLHVFEYNGTVVNCNESYLAPGSSVFSFTTNTGCATAQIRSILVDACSSSEGINEQIIVQNGGDPLNISAIKVVFPSPPEAPDYCNAGCSARTLGNNPSFVNSLNALAGCTLFEYADPIPAGATVVIFSGQTPSLTIDYSSQCGTGRIFYPVFCNNADVTGRFANNGVGFRKLEMSFNGSVDTVSYDRAGISGDGCYVDFTPDGTPAYRLEPVCAYPLGMELLNWTGISSGNEIKLSWQTASEEGIDSYEAERLEKGNFASIGKITTDENPAGNKHYQLTDYSPESGLNYYRLKQVGKNGEFTLSPVIGIAFNNTRAYPGYQSGVLFFNRELTEGTVVIITGIDGRIYSSTTVAGSINQQNCSLTPGNWLLSILHPGGKPELFRLVVF